MSAAMLCTDPGCISEALAGSLGCRRHPDAVEPTLAKCRRLEAELAEVKGYHRVTMAQRDARYDDIARLETERDRINATLTAALLAIEAEREACAREVEDLDCNLDDDLISANEAAAVIRGRGRA